MIFYAKVSWRFKQYKKRSCCITKQHFKNISSNGIPGSLKYKEVYTKTISPLYRAKLPSLVALQLSSAHMDRERPQPPMSKI